MWYLKSSFLVSFLEGLDKAMLFLMQYLDIDVTWIDNLSDFSIHAKEHSVDINKTVEIPQC